MAKYKLIFSFFFLSSILVLSGCNSMDQTYIINTKENYGSLNYHNDTTSLTISLSTPDVYYNITGLNCGVSRFINCSNDNLIITETGDYTLDVSTSFSGGANNEYEIEIFNSDIKTNCDLHRKLGTGGDVGSASITCMLSLNTGDIINLRVEDETNPTSDLHIHSLNFNIVRVG